MNGRRSFIVVQCGSSFFIVKLCICCSHCAAVHLAARALLFHMQDWAQLIKSFLSFFFSQSFSTSSFVYNKQYYMYSLRGRVAQHLLLLIRQKKKMHGQCVIGNPFTYSLCIRRARVRSYTRTEHTHTKNTIIYLNVVYFIVALSWLIFC